MGIWEMMGSAAEAVNRNAPDATSLKKACKTSYDYSAAVATPLKNACKISYDYGSVAFSKLGQWRHDDETKSKIVLYSAKLAKNAGIYALNEGYKMIPGGVAISKIISGTMKDVKYENLKSEKLKELEEKAGSAHEELRLIGTERHGKGGMESFSSVVPVADKSPEDVIRVFMMKEFFGVRFFDALMVPELARVKEEKKQQQQQPESRCNLGMDNTGRGVKG